MAYTFTTAANGDWATGSTWVGGVAPTQTTVKGAFLKIAHAVTIDPTTVPAIGASGSGNGVARIDINGASASLSLANTSAALTITFNSSGTDPVGTGTGPDGGTAGAFDPGTNATMLGILVAGGGTLNLTGTAANKVTITSQDDASPIYIWGGWQVLSSFVGATITLNYCVLKHLGKDDSAGNLVFFGVSYDPRGTGSVNVGHSDFVDSWKGVYFYAAAGSAVATLTNNWFSGAQRGTHGFDLNIGTAATGHTVSGNTWDGPGTAAYTAIRLCGTAPVANDNALYNGTTNGYTLINIQAATNGSFARNALFQASGNTGGVVYSNANPASTGHTITNSVGVYTGNVIQAWGTTTCSNLYGRQNANQASAQGIDSIGYGGTHTFTNCVGVSEGGNGQGFMPYDSSGTGNGASFDMQHCTIVGTAANGVTGILFSDGGSFPAKNSRARSCLLVGLNYGIADPYAGGSTQYTIDTPPNAGVHHNGTYNCTSSYGVGYTSHSGLGSTGFTDGTHVHPNSGVYGDVDNVNPNFVDTTRTELTWKSDASYAALIAGFANRSGMTGATFDTTRTVDNLVTYLFGGFAPRNVAYHNTGHDGTDIGAVPYQSPTKPLDFGVLTFSPLTGLH